MLIHINTTPMLKHITTQTHTHTQTHVFMSPFLFLILHSFGFIHSHDSEQNWYCFHLFHSLINLLPFICLSLRNCFKNQYIISFNFPCCFITSARIWKWVVQVKYHNLGLFYYAAWVCVCVLTIFQRFWKGSLYGWREKEVFWFPENDSDLIAFGLG